MRFSVVHAGASLGSSNLEYLDAPMGLASGAFEPCPAYERVRRIFRQYADAHRDDGSVDAALLDHMWQQRDALDLRVLGPDESELEVEWVMIYDFHEEAGTEGYLIDVCLASREGVEAYWPALDAGA